MLTDVDGLLVFDVNARNLLAIIYNFYNQFIYYFFFFLPSSLIFSRLLWN